METKQQTQEDLQTEEEVYEENLQSEQESEQEYLTAEEAIEPKQEATKRRNFYAGEDRNSFIHGLAVGLGIGCIATFVIVWISVFFTPQMPNGATYENLLSIFIYPLLYLLAVGLIALTAGIVREYYAMRNKP